MTAVESLQSELDRMTDASRAIVHAADDADPTALAAALARSPRDAVLEYSFKHGFRGTLLYRVLNKGVLFANSRIASSVGPAMQCARQLRAAGAPAQSDAQHPADIAVLFLDTDWSGSEASGVLADTMAELICAGAIDVDARLPPNSAVGGMPPLLAACKAGNPAALLVLLQNGANLTAPLVDSGHQDLLALVGSVATTNRGAVMAQLSEHLMRIRMTSGIHPVRTSASVHRTSPKV